MIDVHELLVRATDAFPPGPKQRHHVSLCRGGLRLTLFLGEVVRPVDFDMGDLRNPVDALIESVRLGLQAPASAEETGG